MNECWIIMFDVAVEPAIQHIIGLLNEPKLMRTCRYLCLVGGLSTSPYFQYRMRDAFGPKSKYRLQVIIPERPILAVVEGAAYFAITTNYIKARIMRYTYGEIVKLPESAARARGIPESHIVKYKNFNHYKQQWRVKDCFSIIVPKNKEVATGAVFETHSYRSSPKKMDVKTLIYYSDKEQPMIRSDGHRLGTITSKFDTEDENDVRISLEFHFYDTLIHVVSYQTNTPENKRSGYNCLIDF